MTPLDIRRTILRTLLEVKPFELPFEQLLATVNRMVRPALSEAELMEHLRWLIDKVMIDFLPDDFEPANERARRWLITGAGEAALKR